LAGAAFKPVTFAGGDGARWDSCGDVKSPLLLAVALDSAGRTRRAAIQKRGVDSLI